MRMGLAVFVAAFAGAGCYRPDLERCAITCTDFCPADQTCGGDGYCHADGDTEACGVAPPAVGALAAGDHHACAIDADGHLRCWGDNREGQVGVGFATRRVLLGTQVDGPGGPGGWSWIDGGSDHTCGIKNAQLLCWGDDFGGQAGGPDSTRVEVPATPVDPTTGTGWIAVAAGGRFSCGLRADGDARHLLCWGADYNGQLGDGPGDNGSPLMHLADLASDGTWTDWVEVSAGDDHACARRAGGQVYCWGNNQSGSVGDNTDFEKRIPTRIAPAMADGARSFRAVAAGGRSSCAIGVDGKLYCWGDSSYGKLGIPGATNTLVPRQVGTDSDWTAIAVGASSACGMQSAGVRCWGRGDHGAIGNAAWDDRNAPAPVMGLAAATALAVGDDFACAALAAGGVRCWGDNPEGELGNSNTSRKYQPTAVAPVDGAWTAVAAGAFHTCGIHGGDVLCWGWNGDGALDGAQSDGTAFPAAVPTVAVGAATATEIVVGRSTSCALVDDAGATQPWCWGKEAFGQLGDGLPAVSRRQPGAIGTAGAWSHLAASGDVAAGLLGATRQVWGDPADFGLGNGDSTTVQPAPMDASDGRSWSAVTLGRGFGCGLERMTGALFCWGRDDASQQGDVTTTPPAMTPHAVAAGTVFASVAAAWMGDHACAITAAHEVWCWGRNDAGQGGDLPVEIVAPTRVPNSGSGWTAVAAAEYHTCGIRAGELYCWGANDRGQLGVDDSPASDAPPTRVGMDGGWTAISAGTVHTCGVREGFLYCWGDGPYGEIGDGDRAQNVPGPVIFGAP